MRPIRRTLQGSGLVLLLSTGMTHAEGAAALWANGKERIARFDTLNQCLDEAQRNISKFPAAAGDTPKASDRSWSLLVPLLAGGTFVFRYDCLLDTEDTVLTALMGAKRRIDRAKTVKARAAAWLEFQKAGDLMMTALPKDPPVEQCYDSTTEVTDRCPGYGPVMAARALGFFIFYCGSGEAWLTAETRGYEEYLKLLPKGAHASFARTRIRQAKRDGCCDECAEASEGGHPG